MSFQVQRSTEGYPQAVCARRLRRLRGTVLHGTLPTDGGEGKIVVKGDGKEGVEAGAMPDAELKCLLGTEVRVRQVDCGQLRLVPGDEVVFSCQASRDEAPQGKTPVLEAQLVELLWTPRAAGSGSGSILGCFTLELPRTPEPAAEGEEAKPTGAVAIMDGHALVDRVVLAGLPGDLEVPELMRLFLKLGATDANVVTCTESEPSRMRFASISFAGAVDVARMLVRAAHTINAQGCTQLAKLLPHREGVIALPALPTPSLTTAQGGALLVQWQQVGLAAGYRVELRPKDGDSPWASVGVASEELEDSKNLPAGLLGPNGSASRDCENRPGGANLIGSHCSACRVNCIAADTAYEARVMYYTSWGCRSQASASSAPCALSGGGGAGGGQVPMGVPVPAAAELSAAPLLPASLSMIASAETEAWNGVVLYGSNPAASLPPAFSGGMQSGSTYSLPSPQLPANAAAAVTLAASSPGWRCQHGGVVPPPAPPELVPYEEASRSVCIQWPTVVHATAYTVELLEEGTAAAERFTRAVPEILPEALVELRVGNLNHGAYAACVRCVAPCGCESAPSAWSFLPPLWLPPPPIGGGLGWHGAPAGQAPGYGMPVEVPPHQPAFASNTLLATSPNAQSPPPPPSAPPSWPAASSPGRAASPAGSPGAADDEALVLD